MRILFLATTEDPADWVGPLRGVLPGDEIVVYPEVGEPGSIECALVAVPPPGC